MSGSFFSGSGPSEFRFADEDLRHIRGTIEALRKLINRSESTASHQTTWQFQQVKRTLEQVLAKGSILLIRGGGDLNYEPDEE